MKLYLLRHAPALSREGAPFPNDDRPLSSVGRRKLRPIARGIRAVAPRIDKIFTSPLVRAAATAKKAAKKIGALRTLEECPLLLPGRPTSAVVSFLRKLTHKCVMLVGHEPGLSDLIGELVGIPEGNIELKKGGMALIEVEFGKRPRAALRWVLTAKQLAAIGR